MRAKEARQISIWAFLKQEGYHPAFIKKDGKELWYHSPLRSGDSVPSFTVNTVKNLRYDFGLARGGNALDLVCEVKKELTTIKKVLAYLDNSNLCYCPYSLAVKKNLPAGKKENLGAVNSDKLSFKTTLNDKNLSFGLASVGVSSVNSSLNFEAQEEWKKGFQVVSVSPVSCPDLVTYLNNRKINPGIAKKYLSEIEFKPVGSARSYKALAWACSDGFEARNKFFKGFVGSHKDIIKLNLKSGSSLSIFEGFMDFLAFLTFFKVENFKNSVIILNSIYLRNNAIAEIEKYNFSKVYLFLDNDKSGIETKNFFMQNIKDIPVIDKSDLYKDYKDFNQMTIEGKNA